MGIMTRWCGLRSGKLSSRPRSPARRRSKERPSRSAEVAPSSQSASLSLSPRKSTGTSEVDGDIDFLTKSKLRYSSSVKLKEPFGMKLAMDLAEKRRLMMNLSMRMSRSMSVKNLKRRMNDKERRETSKGEDAIWTKTIILGERCVVPDEEDDTIIYHGLEGNRISLYHPRTACSLPVSRTNSSIDPAALPR